MPNAQQLIAIVAARNEVDRIAATIAALGTSLPGASVYVADDGSDDGTAAEALAAGATVISRGKPHGKGGNMTAAAEAALSEPSETERIFLLCDGDLGETAGRLGSLVETVGHPDGPGMAVAVFSHKVGGGVGLAKGFARRAIRKRCGFEATEPISGQRALTEQALRDALPFAPRFGMEIGMTVDVVRAGHEVVEVEVDLSHRATGRTLRGFVHRGRQLADFLAVYRSRRPR